MQIGTKGRYAVKAMVFLGEFLETLSVVPLSLVAEKESISLIYLEQLFSKLRNAGLVHSVRGKKGGYLFAQSPENISVADIVLAVEDNFFFTQCNPQKKANCQGEHAEQCRTHQLWDSVTNHLLNYLKSVSLASLFQKEDA